MYKYKTISQAATSALLINMMCIELRRGTFRPPIGYHWNHLSNLSTINILTDGQLIDIANENPYVGGVVQGHLDEDGKNVSIKTKHLHHIIIENYL